VNGLIDHRALTCASSPLCDCLLPESSVALLGAKSGEKGPQEKASGLAGGRGEGREVARQGMTGEMLLIQ